MNTLDPKCYPYFDEESGKELEWDGQLSACENDAEDMKKIADSQGFESTILLTAKATTKNVIKEMGRAAKKLSSGDSFLLTYSGHGGKVPDINSDEPEEEKEDETWCLYDRHFIDDELFVLFSEFKAGVHILVLSDSCSSGTVTKGLPLVESQNMENFNMEIFGVAKPVFRLMPKETNIAVYVARSDFYDEIQSSIKRVGAADVKATVQLISACQDDELAADGEVNSKFTEVLKTVWSNGKFDGNCEQFCAAIRKNLDDEYAPFLKGLTKDEEEELGLQHPNYYVVGPQMDKAAKKRGPFSI